MHLIEQKLVCKNETKKDMRNHRSKVNTLFHTWLGRYQTHCTSQGLAQPQALPVLFLMIPDDFKTLLNKEFPFSY